MATARGASGTRCGRFIFIFSPGIDQTAASRSNSAHSAARSSPGRTKVSASQFERRPCFRRALIGRNGAENPAERLGLDDCGAVLDRRRDQGSFQSARRIGLGAAGRDGVTKNLPDGRAEPACRFMPAARFDARRTPKTSGAVISAIGRAPMAGRARLSSHSSLLKVRSAFASRRFLSKSSAAMASNVLASSVGLGGLGRAFS